LTKSMSAGDLVLLALIAVNVKFVLPNEVFSNEELTHKVEKLASQIDKLTENGNQLSDKVSALTEENRGLAQTVGMLTGKLEKLEEEKEELALRVTQMSSALNAVAGTRPWPYRRSRHTGDPSAVAFHADFSADPAPLGQGATYAFDHVVTNIGDGYNRYSGHFRAPVAGIYMFVVDFMAPWNQKQYAYIVVDGTIKAGSESDGRSGSWDHASRTLV
ncbi:hypothetical protein BaRGS_00026396, partial [Batillaria attramentaria]